MIGGAAKQVLDNSNLENVTWDELGIAMLIVIALFTVVFGIVYLIYKSKNK